MGLIIFIVVLVVVVALVVWFGIAVRKNYVQVKDWDYLRSAAGTNHSPGVPVVFACPSGQKISVGQATLTPHNSCPTANVGGAGEQMADVSTDVQKLANGKNAVTIAPADISKLKPIGMVCPSLYFHATYACTKK